MEVGPGACELRAAQSKWTALVTWRFYLRVPASGGLRCLLPVVPPCLVWVFVGERGGGARVRVRVRVVGVGVWSVSVQVVCQAVSLVGISTSCGVLNFC